jgi:hypothetical protein
MAASIARSARGVGRIETARLRPVLRADLMRVGPRKDGGAAHYFWFFGWRHRHLRRMVGTISAPATVTIASPVASLDHAITFA